MQPDEEEERGFSPSEDPQHDRQQQQIDDDVYDDTQEKSPSSESEQFVLHENVPSKTAYYNAASERSLSHQEAKLFYHRHQLEQSQQDFEAYGSLPRARTFSSAVDSDGRLSRTTSTASRKSTGTHMIRDQNRKLPKQDQDFNPQSPQLQNADLCRTGDDANSATDCPDLEDHTEKEAVDDSDAGDATLQDTEIPLELSSICLNIKRVLEIRHKYIDLSLQGPGDNPKDAPHWKIYPPPPNPIWDSNKNRPVNQVTDGNSLSNKSPLLGESDDHSHDRLSSNAPLPVSPTVKQRKAGQNIGEDFDMADLLPLPGKDKTISYTLDESSVYQISQTSEATVSTIPLIKVPTLRDFYKDMDEVQSISSDGPTKSFAYRQLDILEGRFHLYFLVNSYQETADSKKVPHRDFYNVRKVDTHVHHSACMNQKHLLRFIKSKMKKSPDEIVMFRDGKELTLRQVFESINLTAYDLSIDTLDMHVSCNHALHISTDNGLGSC